MSGKIETEVFAEAVNWLSRESATLRGPWVKIETEDDASYLNIRLDVGGQQRGYVIDIYLSGDEIRRLAELITKEEFRVLRKIAENQRAG